MKPLRVDFLLGPDWVSRRIASYGFGIGGYSHMASVLEDERYLDARDDRLGGVPPGVHIRDPKTEPWVKACRYKLMVPDEEYAAWEANLRAKIGDKYASWDILGFFLDRMLHRPGTYDCSALAVNALQHIGRIVKPLPFPAHELTPNAGLLLVAQAGFAAGPVMSRPGVLT